MKKQIVISVIAAVLLLGGVTLMLCLNAFRPYSFPDTTGESSATEEVTTTEEPTEETTEDVTEPPPTTLPPVETWGLSENGLNAKYAFVYDCAQSRLVYAGGDQTAQVAPASLTKLLTAYVVLEHMDLDKVVTVGNEIYRIDPDSSVAYLAVGNRLTVRMLLQGLLMQSGNDAAYTLAVACGRAIAGNSKLSIDDALSTFMGKMNETAQNLGMGGSRFINPDGIDAEGHYTTMEDLLTLSLASMEQPVIMQYCGMSREKVTFHTGENFVWENSNYLLGQQYEYYCEEAIGLKTGTTSGAGKCLISAFRDEDTYLLVAVLGCPSDSSRYGDTLYLYQQYA